MILRLMGCDDVTGCNVRRETFFVSAGKLERVTGRAEYMVGRYNIPVFSFSPPILRTNKHKREKGREKKKKQNAPLNTVELIRHLR